MEETIDLSGVFSKGAEETRAEEENTRKETETGGEENADFRDVFRDGPAGDSGEDFLTPETGVGGMDTAAQSGTDTGEARREKAEDSAHWVRFFREHREYDAGNLPEEMIRSVELGASASEAFLSMKLKASEQALAEARRASELRERSVGSLAPEAGREPSDPFEEAFDRALRER